MNRNHLKFLRNTAIEAITGQRIREYESKAGVPVSLPVPIEKIVEQVLGLRFDWDEIEEQPGETILGGLVVEQRKILLNEKHLGLFKEKPGLERSTVGHEAGHWDIDVDRAKALHPTLPGFEISSVVVKRLSTKSKLLVEVLNRAMTDDRYLQVYKRLTADQDSDEVRSAVDRYQSAMLMPDWLMREAAERFDLTRWPDLYRLAEEAQVTISNLVVRLHRLNMIYIPEGTKDIYRSKDEYTGQRQLF
jgi:hypothetical protein